MAFEHRYTSGMLSFALSPAGEMAKQTFDDLRSEVSAKYGLSAPKDLSRVKDVATCSDA
jgi:hypothetical protein